jgi:Bacteriophage T4-like portal protein (Gp20)
MAYNIFGFEIRKAGSPPALTPPANTDGAIENEVTHSGAGAYGYYLDLNKRLTNDVDLINKYRAMAQVAEIDTAIEDIVNEAIVIEPDKSPVSISVRSEEGDIPEQIVQMIQQEHNHILTLLNFHDNGHDIFRQWYTDGRYYGQIIVDEANLKGGIQEIRQLDPRKMKKVRDIMKKKNAGGADVVVDVSEYFIYNENGAQAGTSGIKLSPDTIVYSTSGLVDEYNNTISYLHKAIKPSNQLRYMEDAALIYTLSRAPSRRVFYIDIADMPKQKADQYMQSIMTKYKNKVVYDSSSGEIKDDRIHTTMLEDYWLPRRSNGRTTEITTLPSESITGQMDNVNYFLNKLYGALNIPLSRLRPDANFSLGRSQEITRDEIKFSKFIDRLRNKFSLIFLQALRVQLVLKGIITPEDWDFIRSRITFDFMRDNYFTELKDAEILQNRINMAEQLMPFVGKFYSANYVRRQVLRQTDAEIDQMIEEIAEEEKNNPPMQSTEENPNE